MISTSTILHSSIYLVYHCLASYLLLLISKPTFLHIGPITSNTFFLFPLSICSLLIIYMTNVSSPLVLSSVYLPLPFLNQPHIIRLFLFIVHSLLSSHTTLQLRQFSIKFISYAHYKPFSRIMYEKKERDDIRWKISYL